MNRAIALVDCNSFYASCETAFRPDLRGKPVIVLSNNDGCVVARSAEAKAIGIEMGAPVFQIQPLVRRHRVAVFSSNYTLYGDMSRRVITVLDQFSPEVENYSIDESFVVVPSGNNPGEFALRIKATVGKWTGIPVSVGVAPTKTLAKLANRLAKDTERGVRELLSETERDVALAAVPVQNVWGICSASARKLLAAGIATAKQLTDADDHWILKQLSIVGLKLVHELRGEPCLDIELLRPRKKEICVSRSFGEMVETVEDLKQAVAHFVSRLGEKLRSQKSLAKVLHVFFFTNTFRENDSQCHRAGIVQLPVPTSATNELLRFTMLGVERLWVSGYRFKKAGVIAVDVIDAGQRQGNLYYRPPTVRDDRLSAAVDRINHEFGRSSIQFAAEGIVPRWAARVDQRSPRYTTRWDELPEVG